MINKILVSCYACSPYEGSEPGMGWNFVSGLSKYYDLHIISERKFEESLKKKQRESPEDFSNLHFHFIEKQRNKLLRKIWPPSYYWFYKQWQKKAYQLAQDLDKKENFRIIHQLNMVGFREPGYLWKMNKPFVWGPIGGMENTSFCLLLNLNLVNFLHFFSRNVINLLQKYFSVRARRAATRSHNYLIAATPVNRDNIKKYWDRNSILMPEVGFILSERPLFAKRYVNDSLRIIWSGLHEARKALNILLKSLSLISPDVNWELIILGSGPMTGTWKRLAERYGINSRCKWFDWLEMSEAHKKMKSSHVVCITSLHDLTSTVTLESLSFGLPVVCIDHCGFSEIINSDCGIKIPVDYPYRITHGFAHALETLYYDEPLRQRLATGAYKRAFDFRWEDKIEKLTKVYSSLLNNKI